MPIAVVCVAVAGRAVSSSTGPPLTIRAHTRASVSRVPKDLDASGGALPAPFLPTAARANTQRAAAPGGGSGPLSGASGDAFVDGPSVTDAQIVVRLPSRRIACGPTLVKAV